VTRFASPKSGRGIGTITTEPGGQSSAALSATYLFRRGQRPDAWRADAEMGPLHASEAGGGACLRKRRPCGPDHLPRRSTLQPLSIAAPRAEFSRFTASATRGGRNRARLPRRPAPMGGAFRLLRGSSHPRLEKRSGTLSAGPDRHCAFPVAATSRTLGKREGRAPAEGHLRPHPGAYPRSVLLR